MAVKKFKEEANPFKWKHFQGDIILWIVRWYCRYALTYRDLKEMALERGLSIERSTICHWVHEYAPEINTRIKPFLKQPHDSWRLDETYLKIRGKWHYLYRAIDKSGNTLDWMLSVHRNKKQPNDFSNKRWAITMLLLPALLTLIKTQHFHQHRQNYKMKISCPKKQNYDK